MATQRPIKLTARHGLKKPYNVKHGVWHNLTMVPDTILLIVENTDASEADSNNFPVTREMLS